MPWEARPEKLVTRFYIWPVYSLPLLTSRLSSPSSVTGLLRSCHVLGSKAGNAAPSSSFSGLGRSQQSLGSQTGDVVLLCSMVGLH